jgi:hypothetical protein
MVTEESRDSGNTLRRTPRSQDGRDAAALARVHLVGELTAIHI